MYCTVLEIAYAVFFLCWVDTDTYFTHYFGFQTYLFNPHPVRGLKLPSEPCFSHLKSIIVYSGTASELCEKIRETCRPRGEFKNRYWFCADTPNIARICCVIMKFRFLPSSQISGRMYNAVVSIKCMM